MISIGKGESVIQVLPPALRFWEKLGLSPKGGRKNVAAYIMFEENARRQPLMERWLAGFTTAYQVRNLTPLMNTTDLALGKALRGCDTWSVNSLYQQRSHTIAFRLNLP
jgi:hypothetical protein